MKCKLTFLLEMIFFWFAFKYTHTRSSICFVTQYLSGTHTIIIIERHKKRYRTEVSTMANWNKAIKCALCRKNAFLDIFFLLFTTNKHFLTQSETYTQEITCATNPKEILKPYLDVRTSTNMQSILFKDDLMHR